MPVKILIIDDEELFREDLAMLLREKDYDCQTSANAADGLKLVIDFLPDIILSDIVMPDRSGIDILDDIIRIHPDASVIIMTAFGTLETAIQAFRKGAADYILKPLVFEDLLNKINRIWEQKKLIQEIKYLRREITEDINSLPLGSKSNVMQKIIELIKKVAPKNSIVLITGESGTGKELVAKAIHEFSNKKNEPFVAINCSGFQESLLESELFGHVKGAFTGAIIDKEGFFETAGEGTIFLDEISEMPVSLQSKLLRVLEQKEFYPVGGTKILPMKARVIAATNCNLQSHIKSGKFREDLYYRIAVFEIDLPPLRKRFSDIPFLVDFFIHKFNKEMKCHYKGISKDVLQLFMSYDWPGNIRELRNVIERAMILCDGMTITSAGLPAQMKSLTGETNQTQNLKEAVQAFEGSFLKRVLSDCNWNKEEAARRLNINPSTLYRKMAELRIEGPTSSK
ncbi:transcriptional regulatory protein ZraR [bacterium BMS3Abin03]|nr:transcriptional regulatory protein ZraR [bacterium BMS3Abin03]